MLTGPTPARHVPLGRILVIALGCAAITWGLIVFPIFWRQSTIERIARRVINGDPFKTETLVELIPALEGIEGAEYCRPAALQSAAVIRLRLHDVAMVAKQHNLIGADLSALDHSIRKSLACSPADSFLWLALFWLESAQNGFRPDRLKYLQMSYRLGPNEGWIGLKRNRIAMTDFERLSLDLKESAIREFIGLLSSSFYHEVVAIFTGPGWQVRELILPRLKDVDKRHRQNFADVLYRQGFDVTIPGIDRPDSHLRH